MKRQIPHLVHALSLAAAAGVTALIVLVHAADLSTLGAHPVVVVGEPHVATASAGAAKVNRVVVAEVRR